MKKVLALDVSTKTGWAYFEDEKPIAWGTVFPDKVAGDFGPYPANYVLLAEHLISNLYHQVISQYKPDVVVVEETNASKQNYSQKILEFLHYTLINHMLVKNSYGTGWELVYVRTGEWRKATEAKMSKEEKALNNKIARIKKKTGKKLAKIDGKVVGKKGRKHVALRVVQETFGIELKRKEEDAADALLLGLGYLRGAPACDGTTNGGKSKKDNT